MRKLLTFLCILLTASFSSLQAASSTFMDYQNYEHGYCPECNCYPCQCHKEGAADVLGVDTDALPEPPCAACGAALPIPGAAFAGPDAAAVPLPPGVPMSPEAAAAAAGIGPPFARIAPPCAKPEPCNPAPVCATNCGIGLCWIGLGIAVVATAAAIIVSANNGSDPSH